MDNNYLYSKPSRKNFTGLVDCSKELQEELWNLHKTFNDYVSKVLLEVFKGKHGKRGVEFQQVFKEIGGSQEAKAKLIALTSLKSNLGSRAKNQANWFKPARKLLGKRNLLFDRSDYFPNDIPTDFSYKVYEMVGQIMQSHMGLIENWKNEKKQWEEDRKKWKEKNADYFSIKSVFDKFEEDEKGMLRLSRERWHKYYEFMSTNGNNLVTWLNKNTIFIPLKQDILDKYKGDPSKLLDLLFKHNSELKKLNALDKIWRREYTRFKRRPSFTYPSAYKHPQFYSFKKTASITYRNLDLLQEAVEVQIKKDQCVKIPFRVDKRLKYNLKLLEKPVIVGKDPKEGNRDHRAAFKYTYFEQSTGETFLAEPRGIKLVFRRKNLSSQLEKHGRPYFYFAIELYKDTLPVLRDLRVGIAKRKARLPEGTKILSVDMGQRDLAAITLTEVQNGNPIPIHLKRPLDKKIVKAWLADIRGLTMDSIASHEKDLSFGLSNMYKSKNGNRKGSHISKGKKGFDRLLMHIANSKENRYKNGAHIILETAIVNEVDVIVMEWLDNYRPTLARDRKHNKRRMQWNVLAIQNFLEQQVKARNMVLYNAPAYHTSKLCYRCGAFGVRCSLPTVKNWIKYYEHMYPGEKRRYIREQGGYFFYCPKCKKLMSADINASYNLAKVYIGAWEADKWSTPKYDEKNNGWKYKSTFINKNEFYVACDNDLKNFKSPIQNTYEF